MSANLKLLVASVLFAATTFAADRWQSAAAAERADAPDFNREVRPILAKHCFRCHGRDEEQREAELRLDIRAQAVAVLPSGALAIVPGSADKSEVYKRITSGDEFVRMPPVDAGEPLSAEEIAILKRWIETGASYARHWSFAEPQRPQLPDVRDAAWPESPLDYFVLSRLEANGLSPSPEADRHTLIRRLSLDLRGLPPTPEEVEAFVRDEHPDAYARLVERFLADPAYGERWARMWLDLARYADSKGYGSDPLREIWRYRDWVIDAFNRNLPFDQFTIEQLAGDLLPEATLEQRMATAMHRNTMTNTEGGTDDEEFRVAAVKDRVDTTLQVWMGLTMGCAKCHNHKYDPIAQEEYYAFFDFFNHTADADRSDESPRIPVPRPEDLAAQNRNDARIAKLQEQLQVPTPELQAALDRWEAELTGEIKWQPLKVLKAESAGGATLTRLEDGSLLASGENPASDTYTIRVAADAADLDKLTGFRLESLPHPDLPGGGSGRAEDGSFVLTNVSAATVPAGDVSTDGTPSARFVRIEIPGRQRILSLAEVELISGGKNVATAGQSRQSSTDYDGPAKLAIDGNTNGHYFEAKSTTHTKVEDDPWWELDLGAPRKIDSIKIWNRTDGNTPPRLADFRVILLDGKRQPVWQQKIAEYPNPSRNVSPSGRLAIPLQQAYAQQGLSAAGVLTADAKGWSAGLNDGDSRELIVLPAAPVQQAKAKVLELTLEFQHATPQATLGRFRLSATADDKLARRAKLPAEISALLAIPPAQRTDKQQDRLAEHYRKISPELKQVRAEIARLEKSRPEIPTLPVMQELPPDKHRQTHVMIKGDFLNPGKKVTADVPDAFHGFPEDAPRNRLGMARWLVDDENPLTSRVMVNRLWAQLLGRGIVETEEDFGTQGELPSHPELLDWLATEFVARGWDIKALLREIVLSKTYRQSSRVTEELLAKDPRNALLSRAPRYRLEAEMVRDQSLALSGLLSRKLGGPSVYPPQPPGLWRAAFNGRDRKWPTSRGADRYRRGLYTFWRRTVPYPSMATFDAPSREICTVRRTRTNTPLQAFVTLNDPVYVEAAQALARRIVRQGGETIEDRLQFALRLCTSRPPQQDQVEVLRSLYERELEQYEAHPQAAAEFATDPLGPLPEGWNAAELAAWTVVASVLLNMDAVLSKG